SYDVASKAMRYSRASRVSEGASPDTRQVSVQNWHASIHHDDLAKLRSAHISAFKQARRELVEEFRLVRPGGEITWIEARSIITYNSAGRAERVTGIYIDVTERRKSEEHKDRLVAELDHRVKNVLACVGVVAQRTRETAKSMDGFLNVLDG